MKTKVPMPGKTVLGGIVAKTLDFAEGIGLDRGGLVRGAGLEGIDLKRPHLRVPFSAHVALWQVIRTQVPEGAFGLRLGASLRARELGLLGYAMSFSSTLRGALRRLVRYGGLLNEAVRVRFEHPGTHHVLVVDDPLACAADLRDAVDARIAGLVAVAREITGVDLVPASVAFGYDRPRSTREHADFFRCPLGFGAPATSLTLRARDLDLPVPSADEQLAGYLSEHAEAVLRTLTGGGTATDGVRSVIWATLSESRPTLASTAATLRLPPRSLQRRLAEEGTSFTDELEHVRSRMAIALLGDASIPIEEVAFLLGYGEPSSFYRSFRRWSGKSPDQYRRSKPAR